MMKKWFRVFAALLAFCVAAATFPPVGLAAAEDGLIDMSSALLGGGAVTLSGNSFIKIPSMAKPGTTDPALPWIINNPITVDGAGYSLTVVGTGILLGADATFENITLNLPTSECRNAIIANGHNLTLDNVKAGAGNRSINLFGGTLIPSAHETGLFSVPSPVSGGTITIKGDTNLQADNTFGPANIYAGSLSMGYIGLVAGEAFDGPNSAFSGPVTIDIQDSASSSALGVVYAGGAQQRRIFGSNGSLGGKVTIPDDSLYTVNGTVTISGAAIPDVDGSGASTTNIVFNGGAYQADKTFLNISSLSVGSGMLALTSGSSFRNSGTLTLGAGAKLLLSDYPDPIPNFQGEGGILILGQNQTLTISGSAAGTAQVAIGGTNANDTQSVAPAIRGKTYITSPSSTAGVFRLLPNAAQPNMRLEQDNGGSWIAADGITDEEAKLVKDFSFDKTAVAAAPGETAEFPITAADKAGNLFYLDYIPVEITINGRPASRSEELLEDDLYYYSYQDPEGYLTSLEISLNSLQVTSDSSTGAGGSPYTIQVTVPADNASDKQAITRTVALTVTDGGDTPDPDPALIPIPGAKNGLKYTGQEQTGVSEGTGYTLTGHTATNVGSYTATAALLDKVNSQWSDNTTADKSISWSIARADGPAAPTGLSASAPTTESGHDGQIHGTTSAMEYASKADFSDKRDCGSPNTAGLTAGTYYVRYKETDTHEAGASSFITVPACGAPTVRSISVNSTAHKTEYKVGDPLDVSDLTIEVTYSDNTKQTVSVTESMVNGFNSSQAAENQVLTIFYEGQTTTYTVSIAANQRPGGTMRRLTVGNTGSGGTAPGDYQYEEGAAVTVQAGTRSGYTFSAWDAVGVTLANRNVPDVAFEMPAGDVTLNAIWRLNSVTPPGHVHVWDPSWTSDGTHHWHDCTASGCPIGSNAQKSGYAAHTAGDWVVDQPAAASQSGVRHRDCTVCGYEMVRETLPAAGGGSSGDSSSGGSSEEPSPSGPSGGSAASVKNPDGSTTSTSTNRTTGTVTRTTKRPDGSATVVETKRDGTVTTTDTAADGSTVKTVARPNGVTETSIKQAGGLTATVQQRPGGDRASVRIPSGLIGTGGSVALPIPALSGENASVTVHTGSSQPVAVEIPVSGNDAATVAYLTGADGRETIVRTALLSGGQITLSVPDGATVHIRDNRKSFQDTQNHWAKNSIDFVAARELFSGTSAGAFSPDAAMSRAMLATVLARLDGADISGGSVYQKSMAWAVAQGISDGRNPGSPVTREQLAAMLYRYAGSPAATDRELRFSDAANMNPYAREAIRWAVENGILSGYGDGTFAPKSRATRAQAAAILERYVRFLNQQ